MTTATRTPPHHNTLTCVKDYRCRLEACLDRARDYDRNRAVMQAAGTWEPLIDAGPVRQHLLELHAAGVTVNRVAAITGVSSNTIRSFTQQKGGAYPQARRYRSTRDVAQKILAIDIGLVTPAFIDSTGALRRLRALVAIGWPVLALGQQAGISSQTLYGLARNPVILSSTAAAVTAAYEKHKNRPPGRATVTDRQLKMARARAASRRWPTPSYWDATGAIDDPGFEHAYKVTRTQVIAEEARWLLDGGLADRDTIADRLGVSRFYLDRSLREHPQDDQAAA